mmetsp:Transcript_40068/g.107304  ORF Transcript_40068/g.107304 Transcript_40068/m.107304 type:complete len:505 (+) Transcript_40068:232-1746(+)
MRIDEDVECGMESTIPSNDLLQSIVSENANTSKSSLFPNPFSIARRWQFWILTAVLALVASFSLLFDPLPKHPVEDVHWDSLPFNTTKTLFIAMNPREDGVVERIGVLKDKIGFRNAEAFQAVNGRQVDPDTLPLYTRYLMENGRHDHHQVSTAGMIGCYLSHVKVMEMMQPGDVFAVFEEDAHFDKTSPLKIKRLHDFVEKMSISFDAIMIGINRVPAPSGKTTTFSVSAIDMSSNRSFPLQYTFRQVGPDVELIQCHKDCTLWGTRGYLITYDGAQKILKHAYPIQTQIDALLSLVARYDSSFRLFWTSQDIALGPALLAIVADINYSKVQDHCLKCHLPSLNIVYLITIPTFFIVVGLFLVTMCRSARQMCAGSRSESFASASLDDCSSNAGVSCTPAKADEERDVVQVQVQPSAAPQLPGSISGGGHRRTNSRDIDLSVQAPGCHRRAGSRDYDAALSAAYASFHRRTASRDTDAVSVASTSLGSLGAEEEAAAAGADAC